MSSKPEAFEAVQRSRKLFWKCQLQGGSTMKLSDLSEKEFKELVSSMVDDRLCELLGDPDLGLALDEKVREQLKQVLNSPERVTGDTVAERLDLHW